MEIIKFADDVVLYKKKFDTNEMHLNALKEAIKHIASADYTKFDNYAYLSDWGSFDYEKEMIPTNGIENFIKLSIKECTELAIKSNKKFNKINVNSWINVVRKEKPKQSNFKKNDEVHLHNHVDLQKKQKSFHPEYTFVYYLQMPDNLSNNEGKLIVADDNDNRYYYMPEEGDLIIMSGYLMHSPEKSIKSTKDRIVIAGNFGIEQSKIVKSII